MMNSSTSTQWLIRALAEGEPILDQETAMSLSKVLSLYPNGKSLYCIAVSYCDISDLSLDPTMPTVLINNCTQACKNLPGYIGGYLGSGLRAVLVFYGATHRQLVANRIYSMLSRRLEKAVRVGVGKAYSDIKKMSYSCVDAFEALDAQKNDPGLFFIDDIYASRSITTRKLDGEKRQIIDFFRAGKLVDMMQCLSNLSERIREESPVREGMPYPSSIRRTVIELLVEILHIGSDAGVDVDAILQHQDPYTRIFALQQTPQIFDWFLGVVERISAAMMEISNQSESNMLIIAKRCIDSHIHDPELSLQLVSEQLGITPGYFSAFFIRQMNMGFNEYITSIRIDLAKKLLCASGKKVNEIANECGFQSASYFIFVFRKKTGLSPGAYRKQNR